MATVAIIHAAEDALPARALAEKLRTAKLTVVLERQPGDDTRSAVKDAKVTVALWSPRAVNQQPLHEDVSFARGKSKLVHAVMQNAVLPEAFRSDPVANLTGWRGEDEFPSWRNLAQLITERAGVAPLPPPAPKPPSGFFQPGRVDPAAEAAAAKQSPRPTAAIGSPTTPGADTPRPAPAPRPAAAAPAPRPQPAPAPRPQPAPAPRPAAAAPPPQRQAPPPRHDAPAGDAPAKKGGGGLVIGAIAAVVVLGLAGGGYYFYSQSQGANATATAWETIDQNDVSALRAFIDSDPGEYREEAQTALAALEQSRYAAARSEDSIAAYEGFLNDFPQSENAIAARGRIAELQTLEPVTEDPALADPAAGSTPNPDLVPPNALQPEDGPPSIASPPAPEPEPSEPEPLPTN